MDSNSLFLVVSLFDVSYSVDVASTKYHSIKTEYKKDLLLVVSFMYPGEGLSTPFL